MEYNDIHLPVKSRWSLVKNSLRSDLIGHINFAQVPSIPRYGIVTSTLLEFFSMFFLKPTWNMVGNHHYTYIYSIHYMYIYICPAFIPFIWDNSVAIYALIFEVPRLHPPPSPGCMGFVMATFYLVNGPDDDIRQISLEVKLSCQMGWEELDFLAFGRFFRDLESSRDHLRSIMWLSSMNVMNHNLINEIH